MAYIRRYIPIKPPLANKPPLCFRHSDLEDVRWFKIPSGGGLKLSYDVKKAGYDVKFSAASGGQKSIKT